MAKGPSQEPEGLVYRPDVLLSDEAAELLGLLELLRFDPIVMHGQAARRTARHYGLDCDYQLRTPIPEEPVPEWLLPMRARAAELAGHGFALRSRRPTECTSRGSRWQEIGAYPPCSRCRRMSKRSVGVVP